MTKNILLGNKSVQIGLISILIVLLCSLVVLFYLYQARAKEITSIEADFASSTKGYVERVADLETQIQELEEKLLQEVGHNEDLAEALETEENKNSVFEEQIADIVGTVGTIEKVIATDPELLQKYSKVYFLNEHYVPAGLSLIDSEYLYNEEKPAQVHQKIASYLEDLLEDAKEDDINLEIVSAFRSFGTQAALKSSYTVIYGSGANAFSADQGYSEHQLGTTVDFTTPTEAAPFTTFETTDAYEWLQENAHTYGFVLSYPEGNEYYQFEPWHWRFVGVDLARELHKSNRNFYDLGQREIDAYLGTFFD